MRKDRFIYLCQEAQAGRDAFVLHPKTREEGLVDSCTLAAQRVIVRTAAGKTRSWNYYDCEELSRLKQEWPRR